MRLRRSLFTALIFVLLLALGSSLSAESITVQQLTTLVAGLHRASDAKAAQELQNRTLSQRLSPAALQTLNVELPGDQSRRALRVLADTSVFLDPPPDEIPSRPAPTGPEQAQTLSHIMDFVTGQIPQLPNFLATRVTLHFEETPVSYERQAGRDVVIPWQPLHLTGSSSANVRYLAGREVVDPVVVADKKSQPPDAGLRTWGIFGPVLVTLWTDMTRGQLSFSHWEASGSPSAPLAVFHFVVPEAQSHYAVNFCCVEDSEHTHIRDLNNIVGYSGDIAVDPASGAILQVRIEADLKPNGLMQRAAIYVEYGPVIIGDRTYICPVRSVALSRAHETRYVTAGIDYGRMAPNMNLASRPEQTTLQTGPEQTMLNESLFGDYHVFRATARMLAKNEAPATPEPQPAPPAPSATPQPPAQLAAASPEPAPAVAAATPPPATASPAAPPPVETEPEIRVLPASRVPAAPALEEDQSSAVPTLHATARIVDVDVVVEDPRGHPVSGLPRSDFALLDDGQPQPISSFVPPTAAPATPAPAAAAASAAAPPAQEFTNRPSAENPSPSAVSDTTILMMDPANLAFDDLNQARRQALRFLATLPASSSVGLYILRSASFQPLLEPTTDHALVASTLAHWIPNAQDLARAQDEENRNRQKLDQVHSVCDLFYVNGNDSANPESAMATVSASASPAAMQCMGMPTDIQLRKLGSDPARDAMLILTLVATHLADLPGRKQLVWITSDNALADWSSQAASKEDKGPNYLNALAQHAQEALNNAHVSLYPLDASQLEAGGLAADTESTNVTVVGQSDRSSATSILGSSGLSLAPGRLTAQLHQDTQSIRGEFRNLATATGGRALPRASDLAAELSSIDNDERGTYRLTFTPAGQPDNRFHKIEVRIPDQGRLRLRYRNGYTYAAESSSLTARFNDAVWQPGDLSDIALHAHPATAAGHPALRVAVSTPDLSLVAHGDRWNDTLDFFLALRSPDATRASLTGEKLQLALRAETRHSILQNGLSVTLPLPADASGQPLRVIVVDENSGRIGSLTIPAAAPAAN